MNTKYLAVAATLGMLMLVLALLGLVTEQPALAQPADVSGSSAEISVCPAGPPDCDYVVIQDAVNAAIPGDTITVYPGTYVENVIVDKDHLTIQSQSGAPSTIVHAAYSGEAAFSITAEYVSIRGFTVGNNTADCDIMFGGVVVGGAHAVISDNTVTGNCKGIVLHASHITVTRNTISDNRAYVASDGIYIWPSCTNISIIDNDISNNMDEGIQQEFGGRHTLIDGNDISDNGGEGIYLGTSDSDLPEEYLDALLFSHDFRIQNNRISSSGENGVYLGTLLRGSEILSNTIRLNQQNGIKFGGEAVTYYQFGQPIGTISSGENEIRANNILTNAIAGVFCTACEDNWIGLNNFRANGDNANSPVSDNFWRTRRTITYTYQGNAFEGYLGNYWDDYAEAVGHDPVDLDPHDGIADDPYRIDDDEQEHDHHPLMSRFESYFPEQVEYRVYLPIVLKAGE